MRWFALLFITTAAFAQNWPSFRGPGAAGVADGMNPPLSWDLEVARFFAALERFDARLAAGKPLANPATKIFAGPVADALTHTGQIAMLRRLGGAKIRGESYYRAEIVTGRLGLEQATPRREFD